MADRDTTPVRVRVAGSQFRHEGEEFHRGDELDVPAWVHDGWSARLDRVDETAEDTATDDGPDASADTDDAPEVDPHPSDLTVAELRDRVAEVENASFLRAIREAEAEAEDPRSTALEAIDDRLADLED